MALQVRRGTNAERLTITPAEGELIYVTDTKQLYVGDGTTQGGTASIANTIDSLLADTTPQLGGNLDLNNFEITGTGNINITGTINATGNINLGDGAGGDVITIGGTISGNLEPDTTLTRNLGSNILQWKEAWISQLNVDSQITAERIQADLIADDSTLVFNAATGQIAAEQVSGVFTGNVVGNLTGTVAGTLDGDVTGSIFADDSTLMVDGVGNAVTVTTVTASDRMTSGSLTVQDFTPIGQGTIQFYRKVSGTINTNDNRPHGLIYFGKDDDAGRAEKPSAIVGGQEYLRFHVDPANEDLSGLGDTTTQMTWQSDNGYNKLGIGYRNPPGTERLQVKGDLRTEGYIATDQIKIQGNQIATTDSNANLELNANGSGTIELTVPVQATVGAAGAAAALPAQPSTYFKINVAGTEYVVPAYAVS